MNLQGRLEEDTVFRENRMSKQIQLCEVLDCLSMDFGFLLLHVLAMMLRIAEQPQCMETVLHTM